jgi:hypothetical protein
MSIRSVVFTIAGAATLALPAVASAQATPPVSQQRIRVQKESPLVNNSTSNRTRMSRSDSIANADRMRRDSLEAAAVMRTRDSIANVERMRADSIAAVEKRRTDSIAAVERRRTDSVAAAAAAVEARRRDSIAAVEAAAAAERERIQREKDRYRFDGSGWYMGLAAGGAVPRSDFEALGYKSGYDITMPIGYQKRDRFLGVRMDLGYSQFSGNNFIGQGATPITLTNSDAKVFSAALNLTANLLKVKGVNLYAVGGGGVYHFRDYGVSSSLSGFLGNDVFEQNEVSSTEKTRTKFGANGGAGIDFGAGPASIYLESRLVNVFTDRDDNVQFDDFFGSSRSQSLRWVPIILGVKIR